jgi:hypothetical protein
MFTEILQITNNPVIVILLFILIPLVPAIILFKLLPSRASVKGPFKGFQINITGSAAIYFLVMVVEFSYYSNINGENYKVYLVTGRVVFSKEKKYRASDIDKISITQTPPIIGSPDSDGRFFVRVVSLPSQETELSLQFKYPDGDYPKSVYIGTIKDLLEKNGIEKDGNTINITKEIVY